MGLDKLIGVLIAFAGVLGSTAWYAYHIGEEETKIRAQLERTERDLTDSTQRLRTSELENSNLKKRVAELEKQIAEIACPDIVIDKIRADRDLRQEPIVMHDGSKVERQSHVFGSVTPAVATGQIWLVIHPQGTGDYWLQQDIEWVSKGKGDWQIEAEFGDEKTVSGQPFEMRAFFHPGESQQASNQSRSLKLNGWPDAPCRSAPVRLRLQ
jgi:hypothetical protein